MRDTNLRGEESIGEVEELTEDDRRAAVLTVCGHATDAADAADLLAMLGLTASSTGRVTTPCSVCLRPMSKLNGIGHVRQHAKGMCSSCYGRQQRGGSPGKQLVEAIEDIDTPVGVLAAGARVWAKELRGAWLLHIPGSGIPYAVAEKLVQVVEGEQP
ncbi:hypothetical protein ACWFRF_20650 [Nocardia sp. NPDC055165]